MFRRHGSSQKQQAQEHHEPQPEIKINELKSALGQLSGRNLLYCTDACLKRYLESRNWNVEKAKKIVAYAGGDGSIVISKLLEQNNLQFGFDAAQGNYVDMMKAGIIDPLEVVRTTLVDAASVSLLLTTTEATVVDGKEEKNPLANRMPNMDDMGIGGMGF